MLLSKDAIGDVAEILQGPDFYRPVHETIYRAILDVHRKGEPADPITVAAYTKIGGAAYLHTLVQHAAAIARNLVTAGTAIAASGYARDGDTDELVKVPTAANAEYYAEIVYERAQERLYGVVRHRGDESLSLDPPRDRRSA